MNRSLSITAIAAAAVLTFAPVGCTQPSPPDTRDADAKAIADLDATLQQDWTAKDAAKIANFYTDDATLDLPNMAALNGKPSILAVASAMVKDPGLTVSITSGKAEVARSGDIGYEKGAYVMTMSDPKSKKLLTEKGKYVTVYKKQVDGSWKAAADVINADAPAAPAE